MDDSDSFVILAGQITAVKPAPSGCYLTLCNQDGFFSIQVNPTLAGSSGHLLCPTARVWVTGRPRSYYHQRRQTNQVVIEAERIAPAEEGGLPAAGLLSFLERVLSYLSRPAAANLRPVCQKEGC